MTLWLAKQQLMLMIASVIMPLALAARSEKTYGCKLTQRRTAYLMLLVQCKSGTMKSLTSIGLLMRIIIGSRRNQSQERAIQLLAKVPIMQIAIASSVISLRWFGRNRIKLDVGSKHAAVECR
jgi:hypothetical protein